MWPKLLVVCLFLLASCASKKKVEDKDINQQTSGVGDVAAKKDQSGSSMSGSDQKKSAAKDMGADFSKYKHVECNFVQEKRVIEIVDKDPQGCEVVYSKYGNSEVKGSAVNETHICNKVLNKISQNLVRAGFICKGK